jgi:hypothetical protein
LHSRTEEVARRRGRRFAFMPDVIPAANDAIMEIAGLMRVQLDPA